MKMFRTIKCGLLGAFLLLGFVAPLTFTSCENSHPEINLEFKSDYSGIIDAINKTNTSLAEKLANIESAIKEGTLKNTQALDAIKAAVASMEGTVAQKLAAIESAVKDQTTSFETKMALIETALNEGFADVAEGQDLMKQALESLEGTVAEKLEAVEKAVKDQTLSLETKLDLINTTVEEGFASIKEGQDLIVAALEAIDGTLQDKMDALEKAIKAQTTTLAAKLAAIEAAVKAGFADEVKALGLVKDAVKAVDGTLKSKLDAIKQALVDGFASEKEALILIDETIKAQNDSIGEIKGLLGEIVESVKGISEALSEGGAIDKDLKAIADSIVTLRPDLAAIAASLINENNVSIADLITTISDALAKGEDGKTVLDKVAELLKEIVDTVTPDSPEKPTGEDHGHAFVKLDEDIVWSITNVGANSPTEAGSFFAWADISTKDSDNYTWNSYAYNVVDDNKYETSSNVVVLPEDDAAAVWGGSWRMPTQAEWEALMNTSKFTWSWTDDYNGTGVSGMVVTSKVEGYKGNSIFLVAQKQYGGSDDIAGPNPSHGLWVGGGSWYIGSDQTTSFYPAPNNEKNIGLYWSANLNTTLTNIGYHLKANCVEFSEDAAPVIKGHWRCYGFFVRPVANL